MGLGRVAKPVGIAGSARITATGGMGATVSLRRYATDAFPVELGTVEPGHTAAVTIAADRSDRPWQLGLSGSGTARVCGGG